MLMQKEVARDFLALHMPEDFLAICDLDSLKAGVRGVLLKTVYAAIFRYPLLCIPNTYGPGYVYALIEHQGGKSDRLMAFRLMRYAIAAMQRHLDAGHDTLRRWWYQSSFITVRKPVAYNITGIICL